MEHVDRRVLLGAAGLAGVAALSKLAHAGPLNPPAGPVTSTGKPLAEIEPRTPVSDATTPGDTQNRYRITQPGSYYLTGNLGPSAGTHLHLIAVDADNVVLDLCGFTCTHNNRFAILLNGRGIVVRNGVVRIGTPGQFRDGLGVYGIGARVCTVEDIVFRDCWVGVNTPQLSDTRGMLVRRCRFMNIGEAAVFLGDEAVVEDCTVHASAGGFIVRNRSRLERCTATGVTTHQGFYAENNAYLRHCVATGGAGIGFQLGHGCTVDGCEAVENAQGGISAESGLRVSNSRARGNNGIGITGRHACQILDSHVHLSTGAGGWGIVLNDHGHVERCQVTDNSAGGMLIGSFARIVGNSIDYHPGTGISGIRTRSNSGGCQILENHVSRSAIGIFLDGGWHLAARNTMASLGTPIANLGTNNNSGVLVTGAGAVGSMTNPSANIYY